MRWMPKMAPITSASRMMQDSTGALTAIRPMRSSPKAMLSGRRPDGERSASREFLSCMVRPVLSSASFA